MKAVFYLLFGSFNWGWLPVVAVVVAVVVIIKYYRMVWRTSKNNESATPNPLPSPQNVVPSVLPPCSAPLPAFFTLGDIDQMDGRTFERFLKTLFEQQGYEVALTPYFGDWGADLVIYKNKTKTLVQAKRWNNVVGMQAVQEIVAAKAKYRAENAMVVTNNFFGERAQELARVNYVVLWDRRELTAQLSRLPVMQPPPLFQSSGPLQTEGAHEGLGVPCALCGKPVSEAVVAYCRKRTHRLGGQVLCYNHQRAYISAK